MKKCLFVFLLFSLGGYAQTIYKTVESGALQETRELKIQLPRNYDENKEKSYSLILVLEGDFLFEPVAGMVDYYSYWDEMPESLVVGINQKNFLSSDIYWDKETNEPGVSSTAFYDFLALELLPYLKETYRLNEFSLIFSHGETANFANYFLIKDSGLFDGFINLSPIFTEYMQVQILDRLRNTMEKKWYYVATATNDFPIVQEQVGAMNASLNSIHRENIFYCFDNFEGKTHYSLVGKAIPSALEIFFEAYSPIGPKEFNEKMLTAESPCDYLNERYERLEEMYGLKVKMRMNDIIATVDAIENTEKWEEYKNLEKLAEKNFPKTMMEDYFRGRFFEKTGKPQKAYKYYKKAYGKTEISYITRDFIWQRMTQLKKDLDNE